MKKKIKNGAQGQGRSKSFRMKGVDGYFFLWGFLFLVMPRVSQPKPVPNPGQQVAVQLPRVKGLLSRNITYKPKMAQRSVDKRVPITPWKVREADAELGPAEPKAAFATEQARSTPPPT